MFSFDLLLVDFGSGGLIFFKDKFLSDQFIAESWIIKQIENISKLDSKT